MRGQYTVYLICVCVAGHSGMSQQVNISWFHTVGMTDQLFGSIFHFYVYT